MVEIRGKGWDTHYWTGYSNNLTISKLGRELKEVYQIFIKKYEIPNDISEDDYIIVYDAKPNTWYFWGMKSPGEDRNIDYSYFIRTPEYYNRNEKNNGRWVFACGYGDELDSSGNLVEWVADEENGDWQWRPFDDLRLHYDPFGIGAQDNYRLIELKTFPLPLKTTIINWLSRNPMEVK